MTNIDINTPIAMKDGSHFQFLSKSGSLVRLRNLADGEIHDMHIATLSENAAEFPDTFTPDVRKFEHLSEEKRTDATCMADHIQEILTGKNPTGEDDRPEYNPSTTTRNQRIATKVLELNELKIPASRATLLRKIKAYREHGTAALADRRAFRRDAPLSFVHEDVVDALCTVIGRKKDKSTGTAAKIIEDTRVLLVKLYGADAPTMPSDASMYRHIKVLTHGKHTTGSAKTRQSLANRPKGPYRKRTEMLPGGEVQIDSTNLDLLVRSPNGEVVRPILTVMFDRATRLVISYTLRLVAAKAVDHVTLLAQALTPPQNRPDNSEFRAAVQRNNPHITLLSPEERAELQRTRPHVHPRTIVVDNGKDFISDTFLSAVELHRCDVRFSAPHTPTSKPLVERNFASINTLFCQSHNGYVGRSPEFRGYKVENQQLMDIYALNELLDDWFLKVWNHRPHKGLRDSMNPEIIRSPYMAYTAATKLTSNLETTLTRNDYIAMLPSVFRKVTATGVVINYRQFDSEDLNPLRNTRSSNAKKKGKHTVKLDPYNPFYAWVEDPEGGWIQCSARDMDANLYPHLEDRDFDVEVDVDEGDDDRTAIATVLATAAGTPLHTTIVDDTPTTTTDELEDDGDQPTLITVVN